MLAISLLILTYLYVRIYTTKKETLQIQLLCRTPVPLPEVGTTERVAPDIAEGCAGRGNGEGIGAVVVVDRVVCDWAGAEGHIGAHDGFTAAIGDAARDVVRRRGCPRFEQLGWVASLNGKL